MLAIPVVLATEAAEESNNVLVPETNELIWATVSFAVLFVIIAKFVFPVVRKTLEDRTENIEGKLERAEADLQAARELRRDYEQRLDEATAEAQRIMDEARSQADRLSVELRTDAEDQAKRIIENARETIRGEHDRALASLRSQVGELAVDLAARVIGESLDRDRQLRLVDQYIGEISNSTNGHSGN